jgi:hypothetical protein
MSLDRSGADIITKCISSFQDLRVAALSCLSKTPVAARVARWFILRPKNAIREHFGESLSGRCWCILWTLGLFYGHLIYSMAIWYGLL